MVLKGNIYRKILVILVIAGIFISSSMAQPQSKPHRRVMKASHKLWGDHLEITAYVQATSSQADKEQLQTKDRVFFVFEKEEIKGYVISSSAKGRYDDYDYSVIFDDAGVVRQVLVTVYRSDHGAAISQKNWLSQFEGYQGGSLELGKDIDAVSGGTLSASSLLEEMERLHILISSLIDEKSP